MIGSQADQPGVQRLLPSYSILRYLLLVLVEVESDEHWDEVPKDLNPTSHPFQATIMASTAPCKELPDNENPNVT